jgi:hypothetical protein
VDLPLLPVNVRDLQESDFCNPTSSEELGSKEHLILGTAELIGVRQKPNYFFI